MKNGWEEIRRDYNEAVKFLLEREQVDTEKRNILISHQFYTAGGETPKTSDSETISVGGLDQVDISCLAPFSYVALGHIHRPQSMGRESIRYCGSMLKYSVSEWEQEKSVTEVILEAPGQEPVIQLHPLHPLREICVIRGRLEEILEANKDSICEDYVSIVLTDEEELYQPKEQLERIFTHILEVRTRETGSLYKNGKTDRQRIHRQIRNWFLNSSFPRFRDGSCRKKRRQCWKKYLRKSGRKKDETDDTDDVRIWLLCGLRDNRFRAGAAGCVSDHGRYRGR